MVSKKVLIITIASVLFLAIGGYLAYRFWLGGLKTSADGSGGYPKTSTISGTIVAKENVRLLSAMVALVSPSGQRVTVIRNWSLSNAYLKEILGYSGDIIVAASAVGYKSSSKTIAIEPGGDYRIDFVLDKLTGAKINVTVQPSADIKLSSLEGISVYGWVQGTGDLKGAFTDKDGKAQLTFASNELDKIQVGAYLAPKYVTNDIIVDLKEGAEENVSLTLVAQSKFEAWIRGSISCSWCDKSDLGGADVKLSMEGLNPSMIVKADKDGNFSFPALKFPGPINAKAMLSAEKKFEPFEGFMGRKQIDPLKAGENVVTIPVLMSP